MDIPHRKWHPRIEPDAGSKYLGIVEALAADLRAGRLRPGDRLPAQRVVAEALAIDLTTVTRAFNEARARGLIDASAGRGTFISAAALPPQAGPPAPLPSIDLSLNIPPQPEAAGLAQRLPETIAALLGRSGGLAHLNYQESGGSEPDRTAGAAWLAGRIPGLSPGRIVVAAGAQNALFAVCHALGRSGDTIAAGALTYPGIQAVATQLGLRLTGLAMDAGGILPDAFAEECARRRPAALYVVPSIDNPTTATLPEERRSRLVEIARQYGVAIIEDDPYGALLDAPPPALAALAPELTWHIATLSKCVTPALRIAYVAVPGTAATTAVSATLRAVSLMAPPLMAAVATNWIGSGVIEDIAAAVRAESRTRQQIAAAELAFPFAADPSGHHLWLPLPHGWRAVEFAYHAERSGLSVVPASSFAIASPVPEAVRVSLGAAPDRMALRHALGRLAGMLSRPPASARAVV